MQQRYTYINNLNTLYSLRVGKYNKIEFQEGLAKFQFKLSYVEEQLFVAVSVSSYKNGSLMDDV